MKVEVQNSDDTPQKTLTSELCTECIAAIKAHLKSYDEQTKLDGAICIRTVGLEESQLLNSTYRGQDKPTNVLSFPAEIDGEERILGDLAICWPVVEREASEQGKTLAAHATHLVVHGILHLVGFDHEVDAEADEMEALEVVILAELDVTNPYV